MEDQREKANLESVATLQLVDPHIEQHVGHVALPLARFSAKFSVKYAGGGQKFCAAFPKSKTLQNKPIS